MAVVEKHRREARDRTNAFLSNDEQQQMVMHITIMEESVHSSECV